VAESVNRGFFPILADCFLTHDVDTPVRKHSLHAHSTGLAAVKPLIHYVHRPPKTSSNDIRSLCVSMKTNPTLGRVIVHIELRIQIGRLAPERGREGILQAHAVRNLLPPHHSAFATLIIGSLALFCVTQIVSRMLVQHLFASSIKEFLVMIETHVLSVNSIRIQPQCPDSIWHNKNPSRFRLRVCGKRIMQTHQLSDKTFPFEPRFRLL